MEESKYTCAKCGKSYLVGPSSRGPEYAGVGQCPKCQKVLCSNCYVQGKSEIFGGMMAVVNQCPDCKVMLKPPPGA